MNVKCTVAYDGSQYKGSQRQPNKLSVEDQLMKAFSFLNIEPKITLSGRTDKEVHASGQVFNIRIPNYWSNLSKLTTSLNRVLPDSIVIRHICRVNDEFHARFHAKKRVYRYLVTTKALSPFNSRYITHVESIDEKRLKEAMKVFIGEHDFEYFHKRGSDKENLIREIYEASFYKYKDVYVFKFTANSYLRSQIRLMVGFLLKISQGKLSASDLKEQLQKKRYYNKVPAIPNGLYLAKVKY